MSTSRTKNAIFNIGVAFILQIISALSGLILPRVIIPKYGSDINGLIVSITQFLSYVSLLEGGVEGVIRASLYEPIARCDFNKVTGILRGAIKFFRKVAIIFIIYLVFLCLLYPVMVARNFDPVFTITMIIILSLGTFLQYYFSLPYISLLSADQKVRIVYITDGIIILLNLILSFLLVYFDFDILIIKLCSSLLFIIKPVFFTLYVKKKYNLQLKDNNIKPEEIKQKWNGLAHHLAYFIHINTDVFVISLILTTKEVSVYAVYYAIVSSIERVISSISVGSAAGIGNLINTSDKNKINSVIDKFEFIQGSLVTILYTITSLVMIPFIKIYTVDMTDANYILPTFAYVIILAEALYCIRLIYSTITFNANKYKETQKNAIIECSTNVIFSLVLVWKFGLIGVAIGTAFGMFIRTIMDVIYLSKNVIERNISKYIKFMFINIGICIISLIICKPIVNIIFDNGTWGSWILTSVICGITVCCISFIIYIIFYKKIIKQLLQSIKILK